MGGLASTRRFSLASALLSLIVIVLSFSSHAAFPCVFDEAVETEGHRRLALIVGVGQYASEGIPDPPGVVGRPLKVRGMVDKNSI